MPKLKLRKPKQKKSIKKFLTYFVSGLGLMFLLIGFLLDQLIAGYAKWLSVPTVIVFTNQNKTPQPAAVLIMNLQADLSQSQLVLIPEPFTQPATSQEFAHDFGVLTTRIINLDQESTPKDISDLTGWLRTGAYRQIKNLDLDSRYTLLAMKLLKHTQPTVIAADRQNQDFFKFGLQEKIKPLVSIGARCPITVSNATAKAGLASEMADFLTRQGGNVVRVTNYPQTLDQTEVLVDQASKDCQPVAQLLADSLSNSQEVKIVPQLFYELRSQIELRIAQ